MQNHKDQFIVLGAEAPKLFTQFCTNIFPCNDKYGIFLKQLPALIYFFLRVNLYY